MAQSPGAPRAQELRRQQVAENLVQVVVPALKALRWALVVAAKAVATPKAWQKLAS